MRIQATRCYALFGFVPSEFHHRRCQMGRFESKRGMRRRGRPRQSHVHRNLHGNAIRERKAIRHSRWMWVWYAARFNTVLPKLNLTSVSGNGRYRLHRLWYEAARHLGTSGGVGPTPTHATWLGEHQPSSTADASRPAATYAPSNRPGPYPSAVSHASAPTSWILSVRVVKS